MPTQTSGHSFSGVKCEIRTYLFIQHKKKKLYIEQKKRIKEEHGSFRTMNTYNFYKCNGAEHELTELFGFASMKQSGLGMSPHLCCFLVVETVQTENINNAWHRA